MNEFGDEYTINDLLWYQEGLSDYLEQYYDGIEFEYPYDKDNMIYILFSPTSLKNKRTLSQKEYDSISIKD